MNTKTRNQRYTFITAIRLLCQNYTDPFSDAKLKLSNLVFSQSDDTLFHHLEAEGESEDSIGGGEIEWTPRAVLI